MRLFIFFCSSNIPLNEEHVSEEGYSLPLLVSSYYFDGCNKGGGLASSGEGDERSKGEIVVKRDFSKVYSKEEEISTG